MVIPERDIHVQARQKAGRDISSYCPVVARGGSNAFATARINVDAGRCRGQLARRRPTAQPGRTPAICGNRATGTFMFAVDGLSEA